MPGSFPSPVKPQGPITSTSDTEGGISRCTYQLGYRLKRDYSAGEERRDRKTRNTSKAMGPPVDGGREAAPRFTASVRGLSLSSAALLLFMAVLKGIWGFRFGLSSFEMKRRGLAFSESGAVGMLFVFFVVQC